MKKLFKRQKIVSFLLVLCTTIGIFAGAGFAAGGSGFTDLQGYEWAEDAIGNLKDAGIVNGTSSNTFAPGDLLKRAELAVILCRAFIDPNPPEAASGFQDVDGIVPWAEKYIALAKQYFYTGNNEFKPNKSVTREELVYTLVKVLGLDTTGVSTAEAQEKYSGDWDSVMEEYKAAVALATKLGFVSGDGNGRFRPTPEVTRAEMAVLTYRAMKFGGGIGGGKFFDVKPGDWYYNAVMNLANRKIPQNFGNTPTTYEPNVELKNKDLLKWLASILNEDEKSDEVINKIPAGLVSDDINVSVIDEVYKNEPLTREIAAYSLSRLCNLPEPEPESVSEAVYGFADKDDINPDYLIEVASVIIAGYMKGGYNSSGELVLNPAAAVTKAQMAVLMVNALPSDGKKPGQVFSDVAPGDWFYDGVMYLYNKGIVNGHPDGSFKPLSEDVADIPTRATLAALICRILNLSPDETGFAFTDPEFESIDFNWSKGFVWVSKDYFISEDASFYPARQATRMEIAYAAAKLFDGYDPANVNYDAILRPFNDSDSIPVEYKPAMAYLVSAGVIKGTAEGELNPLGITNRAEMSVFLARALIGIDKSKMKDYKDTIEAVKEGEGQ